MLVQVGSRYVNTDHIVSIEGTAAGWIATLVTGKSISFPAGSLDPDDLCGAIIPAPAGTMLVEAHLPSEGEDDRQVRYRTSTVRAFRITEGTTAPVPIGAFGEPKTRANYEYAVLQPDGQCFGWEQVWDSLDAFRAEQQAWAEGRQQSAAQAWPGLGYAHAPRLMGENDPQDVMGSSAIAGAVERLHARVPGEPDRPPKRHAPHPDLGTIPMPRTYSTPDIGGMSMLDRLECTGSRRTPARPPSRAGTPAHEPTCDDRAEGTGHDGDRPNARRSWKLRRKSKVDFYLPWPKAADTSAGRERTQPHGYGEQSPLDPERGL